MRVQQGLGQDSQSKSQKVPALLTGKYNPFPILTGTFLFSLYISFFQSKLQFNNNRQWQTSQVKHLCTHRQLFGKYTMPLSTFLFYFIFLKNWPMHKDHCSFQLKLTIVTVKDQQFLFIYSNIINPGVDFLLKHIFTIVHDLKINSF